jgi:PAS domain S-box-containing protein
MMNSTLNILIVEDSEDDVFFLKHTLRKAGYEIQCEVVDSPEKMKSALQKEQNWDVITSDHSMPQFSAPEALAIAKQMCPDVPFIIISGEIDLNLAVSLMKGGAQDYIQKHEIARVVPAIERELFESEVQRDRQRVGNALVESDNRFQEVLENSLDASFKRNLITNEYEYLSPVFNQITGYSSDEMRDIIKKSVRPLIHPEDTDRFNSIFTEALAMQQKRVFRVEYRFKHKKGHYIWLLHKFSVTRDNHGKPIALFGSLSDISEQKKAEEELLSAHRRLESIIEGTRAGTWEWNVQTGETVFNERWAEILGYSLKDLGIENIHTWERLTHPEDLKKTQEILNSHFSGEATYYDCEFRMKHKDGYWVWIHDRGRVFTWTEDGKPLMMYGTHVDISERKAEKHTNRKPKKDNKFTCGD